MIRIPTLLIAFYSILSLTSMAAMNIGFAGVFAAALLAWASDRKTLARTLAELSGFKTFMWLSLALAGACLLSLVVARLNPWTYAGVAPVVTPHGFLKIWYLLCPLILSSAFCGLRSAGEVDLRFILNTWWSMTVFLLMISIIQYNTGWPLNQVIPTNPEHFHATLFFGHHLSTASILIFPTFTALAVAIGARVRGERVRVLETLAGIAGLIVLFLSYARTAWLAIPLGLALIFMKYLKPKTVLAALFSLALLIGIGSQTPAMKERIHNSMGIVDRLRLWEANFDYFKHRPLTGIGWLKTQEMSQYYFKERDPEHYTEYFWGHAHSNFFEMLGGTGLIGTLAWLLWSAFTLRLAWMTGQKARQAGNPAFGDVATGIFIALFLLHFNGLTNVTFWEGKVMHQQTLALGILFFIQLSLRDQ